MSDLLTQPALKPDLADTQPHLKIVPPPVRYGCRTKALIAAFAAFIIPVFLCGIWLLVYLLFPPAQTNILILGVDGRDGEGFVSRTDSMMILGINPSSLRISLLSIPRDLFIDVPGYGSQRVNTINMLGEQEQQGAGSRLAAQSLESNFDITISRYARLDFSGFVDLIDAVGGVTIDVHRTIIDDAYPTEDFGVMTVRFDSGIQHMDGERALIYARTRHADDDYNRAARQQQVLSALAGKLANPLNWPAVLRVINTAVDTNLTLLDMFNTALPIILNAGRFEQLVIDRDYILGTASGSAVPNYDLIKPWLVGRFR